MVNENIYIMLRKNIINNIAKQKLEKLFIIKKYLKF